MDGRTDKQTYLLVEMQFYISVMFLGLPDDVQEKPSFLQLKKTRCRPTNRRTDRPFYRDARMHLKKQEKDIDKFIQLIDASFSTFCFNFIHS